MHVILHTPHDNSNPLLIPVYSKGVWLIHRENPVWAGMITIYVYNAFVIVVVCNYLTDTYIIG